MFIRIIKTMFKPLSVFPQAPSSWSMKVDNALKRQTSRTVQGYMNHETRFTLLKTSKGC